jgi:hypothetical protein
MGKLTPEKDAEIKAKYAEIKSYKLVADKLGIDWKTVKAHVSRNSQKDGGKEHPAAIIEGKKGEEAANSSAHEESAMHQRLQVQEQTQEQYHQQPKQPQTLQQSEQPTRTQHNNQQKQKKSPFARTLSLFEKGQNPVQVAFSLDLTFEEVEQYYAQYGRLQGLRTFFEICHGPHETLNAILELHKKMLRADMDPAKTVQQLQYIGPIENASITYQRLKEGSQKLQVEIQEREKKNAGLALAAGQLKAQSETLQNNIAASRGQLKALDNQCREKQAALVQLQSSESKIYAQIKSARAMLNDLTAKNGPIQTQIREDAEKKAYDVLNNNELVLGTCVAAAISVMMQDPIRFIDFHNQYPMCRGEDTAAYIQRCMPFFKEKFESIFNRARADFAREVSNFAAVKQYNS